MSPQTVLPPNGQHGGAQGGTANTTSGAQGGTAHTTSVPNRDGSSTAYVHHISHEAPPSNPAPPPRPQPRMPQMMGIPYPMPVYVHHISHGAPPSAPAPPPRPHPQMPQMMGFRIQCPCQRRLHWPVGRCTLRTLQRILRRIHLLHHLIILHYLPMGLGMQRAGFWCRQLPTKNLIIHRVNSNK